MNQTPTRQNPNDTIVACATPEGYASIGVIRVSGEQAEQTVKKVFRTKHGVRSFESHRAYFGDIVDPKDNTIIDKVIVTFHKHPFSYTGEDVIEISCHGNPLIIDRIIGALITQGTRIAEKGEFTKRALLNNKIDLLQAEAVLDTVYSPCDEARKLAIAQYEGRLSNTVDSLSEKITNIVVLAETQIDFSEEDDIDGRRGSERLLINLTQLEEEVSSILKGAEIGIKMKHGYRVLIMGRSNVGKSTLFNRLVGYDRALIHHAPGTTRDYLEERIELSGLLIRLFDTAGLLNEPHGPDEIAQNRSKQLIEQADLIVLLFDGSEPMNEQDVYLYNLTRDKNTVSVVNKVDLNVRLVESTMLSDSLKLSAKTGKNIDALISRIRSILLPGFHPSERPLITKQRHMQIFQSVHECVKRGITSRAPEVIAFEAKEALQHLGSLTGETLGVDVLDRIFEEFCIGK
jgi:tRNA modification GTPase